MEDYNKNLTFGNFINNYYFIFINVFNKCTLQDKIKLTLIKFIHILIVLFLILGWLLPKKYLVWHITMCFITIFTLDVYDNSILNDMIYQILKNNINDDKININDQLLNASKIIPISTPSIKNIVIVVMILSIIGYIYPNLSGNNLINSFNKLLNDVKCTDISANDQLINTEFKINQPTINQIILPQLQLERLPEDEAKLFIPVLTNNFALSSNEPLVNISDQSIDLNNVDSNLSIFNIKIVPPMVRSNIRSNVQNNYNLTNNISKPVVVQNLLNKEKIMNSLKKFNEIV